MAIRTGIFGGSFNPVHKGHIALAEQILKSGLLDEIWLMVSPQNPLKENNELWDDQFRLHLARLAVAGHPNIQVSDFEFELPRPSYTYFTLRALKKAYPQHLFTLIIGADNWNCFHKWKNYDEILKEYPIIVYPRAGFQAKTPKVPANITFLHLQLYPISSTEIRQKLKQGDDVSPWLDSKVDDECRKALAQNESFSKQTVSASTTNPEADEASVSS